MLLQISEGHRDQKKLGISNVWNIPFFKNANLIFYHKYWTWKGAKDSSLNSQALLPKLGLISYLVAIQRLMEWHGKLEQRSMTGWGNCCPI